MYFLYTHHPFFAADDFTVHNTHCTYAIKTQLNACKMLPRLTLIQPPLGDDIKPCPRCAAYIIKMNDGSCNHMTCAVCGCEFCWLCMKEISDLHYLR